MPRATAYAAILIVVVVLVTLVGSARASTTISGTISSNQTWDLAGSPYIMTGDVTIAADRIGGGTAGALRYEARSGIKVAGKNHRQKAGEIVVALRRLLARENLTKEERYVALRNLRNLEDAIRLFDQKRPNGYIR